MDKKKLWQYIERERLLTRGDKALVALSGGADSVALLRLLLEYGCRCEAAHCNFHLRGWESDRDEAFVRRLCGMLDVPIHVAHFDTRAEAARRHISIEMAARDLRYAWFERLREECGAVAVAVAHHADDCVETLLLNLIRGTGIGGLQGIRPRNGRIVRPLLCLTRTEVLDYLDGIGQTYVTDSTNLEDTYTRNKIRLNVLPLLETINPSVRRSLWQTALRLGDAAAIYRQGIEEGRRRVEKDGRIDIAALLSEPAPETLLFELLRGQGFNGAQVHDICQALHGQPGKTFHSATATVVKDRDSLIISSREAPVPPRLRMETVERTPSFVIPRDRHTACLDADKLSQPLSLRLWQHGDTFVPFGMTGRKKVSDYLTDRKLSVGQKARQWVLCSGGDIVWLVGERPDDRFRVDEWTRRILVVREE